METCPTGMNGTVLAPYEIMAKAEQTNEAGQKETRLVRRPVIHGPLEVVVSAPETRASFHPEWNGSRPVPDP